MLQFNNGIGGLPRRQCYNLIMELEGCCRGDRLHLKKLVEADERLLQVNVLLAQLQNVTLFVFGSTAAAVTCSSLCLNSSSRRSNSSF